MMFMILRKLYATNINPTSAAVLCMPCLVLSPLSFDDAVVVFYDGLSFFILFGMLLNVLLILFYIALLFAGF